MPTSHNWNAGEATVLGRGVCHVWWARPAALADAGHGLLNAVERCRLLTLRKHDDQVRFAAACGVARLALGTYLGCPPAAVILDRTCEACGAPHGRPRLRSPSTAPLELSVSHSGDRVGVAVAYGTRVGIDVEAIRSDLPIQAIAPSVLSAHELDVLGSHPPEAQTRRLLEFWTRKEALLKALGVGLRLSPASIETLQDRPGVTVRDLHAGDGHVAAVAVLEAAVLVDELDARRLLTG